MTQHDANEGPGRDPVHGSRGPDQQQQAGANGQQGGHQNSQPGGQQNARDFGGEQIGGRSESNYGYPNHQDGIQSGNFTGQHGGGGSYGYGAAAQGTGLYPGSVGPLDPYAQPQGARESGGPGQSFNAEQQGLAGGQPEWHQGSYPGRYGHHGQHGQQGPFQPNQGGHRHGNNQGVYDPLQGPGYGHEGQGAWQQGHRPQDTHQDLYDPDYHQWRSEQMRSFDEDYRKWRQERFRRFSDEFNQWRQGRSAGNQATGQTAEPSQDEGTKLEGLDKLELGSSDDSTPAPSGPGSTSANRGGPGTTRRGK